MAKRLLSVILITSIFVLNFDQYKAEANPAVLAAELAVPAATLLVAAGVSAGAEGLDALARWWYSEAGQDVRDQLAADWAVAVEGIMNVSDSVWSSLRSWVQSKFVAGTGSISISYQLGDVIKTLLGDATLIVNKRTDGKYDVRVAYWAGSTVTYSGITLVDTYLYVVGNKIYWHKDWWVDTYRYIADDVLTDYVPIDVSYVGADVLSNPTWDWQESGERKVTVPSTLDVLDGKTYSDVIVTGDTTLPGDTTAPAEKTLTDVWQSIVDLPQSIADSIAGLFVPTLTITDVLSEIKSVAMTKAPFAWFSAWQNAYNQSYSGDDLRIGWQAGLKEDQRVDLVITANDVIEVRNITKVILLSIAVWYAYAEVRRWLG